MELTEVEFWVSQRRERFIFSTDGMKMYLGVLESIHYKRLYRKNKSWAFWGQ